MKTSCDISNWWNKFHFSTKLINENSRNILKLSKEIISEESKMLHDKLTIVPIDKASGNIEFFGHRYYGHMWFKQVLFITKLFLYYFYLEATSLNKKNRPCKRLAYFQIIIGLSMVCALSIESSYCFFNSKTFYFGLC